MDKSSKKNKAFEKNKEEIREYYKAVGVAGEILLKRYEECDEKGHKKPEDNHCNYCHRRLEYKTPKTDAIFEEREKLPYYLQPMDAPIIEEKEENELALQESIDFYQGCDKIIKELKESGELEKLLE